MSSSSGSREYTEKSFANKALDAKGFARQQWRAWIETELANDPVQASEDSPASNGGRGLKRVYENAVRSAKLDSPASNGGRGLKHGRHLPKQ